MYQALACIIGCMATRPFNYDQRQTFIDNLPPDQVNPIAAQTFDKAIARAVQPMQSKPETPEQSDGYSDTQTHSDITVNTSDSRSDTSHQ